MRDYLSPAKRYVSRVISHPGTLGMFVVKRKHFSFAIAASFIAVTILGFVAVKGTMHDSTVNQDATNVSNNSSISMNLSTDNLPDPMTPTVDNNDQSNKSTSYSSPQASNSPTVTVNNQSIPVPANGTVNRTIQSSNGTTDVKISVESSGDSSNSSNSSTSLQVNTNTSSHKSEFHSQ